MKPLHIIDHFSLGGAQRIVEGILDVFPQARLLPLRKKGSDAMQFAIAESRYLLKPRANLFSQLINLLKVPRMIAQEEISIIHCHLHYAWFFGLWTRIVLGRRAAPRLIFHEHDSIHLTRWYYPILVRWLSRYGSFIAVSRFIYDQIAACGVAPQQIHLLRNFVDLSRFSPPQPNAKTTSARLRVGFAGRLVEYKGWRVVLQLAEMLPKTHFLIAGSGADAAKIASEIEQNGLQERVVLLGYVQNMETFYHQIDLLIIPSAREAFGLVQIEAQACGVPVVVFDSEAAQEIHGDGSSVLVPNGDIAMLARKVEELQADNTFYQKMVEKSLANASLYSLADYGEQLNAIYQAVLRA